MQAKYFRQRLLVAFTLILLGFVVSDTVSPHQQASAQNAGVVGIQAQMTPVFSTQASNTCSAILPDIGQGQNTLFLVTSTFTGTIDLEWSPTKNAPFYPLVLASYVSDTSSSHTLYSGSYFPNLRSCVSNVSHGNVSAWYTATSGPIASNYTGIGSSGPTSPPVCDQNTTQAFSASSLAAIGTIQPLNSGNIVVICGFTIGFSAAASAGAVSMEFWSASNCTGTETLNWTEPTTSSTPQLFTVNLPGRSAGSNLFACFQNTSTTAGTISVSWASVQL